MVDFGDGLTTQFVNFWKFRLEWFDFLDFSKIGFTRRVVLFRFKSETIHKHNLNIIILFRHILSA